MSAEVIDHIGGLSSNEVAERKARGEVNAPPPAPGRTYRQIVLENVFSFIDPSTASPSNSLRGSGLALRVLENPGAAGIRELL